MVGWLVAEKEKRQQEKGRGYGEFFGEGKEEIVGEDKTRCPCKPN